MSDTEAPSAPANDVKTALGGESTSAVQGASVSVQYAKRTMRMYAINESEAATLSSFNAQSTAYLTLASFLLSAALGIYTNSVFYKELTPAGQLAEHFVAPLLLSVGTFFVILAVVAMIRRTNFWRNIKNESS